MSADHFQIRCSLSMLSVLLLCGCNLSCGPQRITAPPLTPTPIPQEGAQPSPIDAPPELGDPSQMPLEVPGASLQGIPSVGASQVMTLPAGPTGVYHEVREGETIRQIAGKYGRTADQIAKANALPSDVRIDAGQLLYIP